MGAAAVARRLLILILLPPGGVCGKAALQATAGMKHWSLIPQAAHLQRHLPVGGSLVMPGARQLLLPPPRDSRARPVQEGCTDQPFTTQLLHRSTPIFLDLQRVTHPQTTSEGSRRARSALPHRRRSAMAPSRNLALCVLCVCLARWGGAAGSPAGATLAVCRSRGGAPAAAPPPCRGAAAAALLAARPAARSARLALPACREWARAGGKRGSGTHRMRHWRWS